MLGSAVTWEPNALDGKDADFANQKPYYDASGRFTQAHPRHHREGVAVGHTLQAGEQLPGDADVVAPVVVERVQDQLPGVLDHAAGCG